MKQFLRYILTLVALFVATANLSAQTYNGGTWYSLYETGERTLSTIDSETLNAFTPVGTNLTFDAKRAATGLGNLKVAPIVNGQQQSDIFDQKPGKVTKKNFLGIESRVDYTDAPYSATVSNSNSNQIKFYTVTGATLNKYFKNVKLPLKKHILLYDDTDSKGMDYGTSSIGTASTPRPMANLATAEGKTSTSAYTIRFRSFLASGDITITSNNSEFHFWNGATSVSLNTENNYFARIGGTASKSSTNPADHRNVDEYETKIYFSPSVQYNKNTRSTTITISDGTSTAYIYLSAPVIPTYFFKAEAIASPADGGTATASFANGQSTYSIIAPDYATSSVSTTVTFTATPNSANGYVYDGWKKQLSDTECNPKGAGTESFSETITSSDLNPNNISSTRTYYAIFTRRYTPIIKNLQNYTNKLVGVPIENLPFQFIDAATEYPSASDIDDFYYTIDNKLDGGSTADCPVEHRGKVIDYYPTEKKIIPRNAGTATITFYHKSTNTHNAIEPVSVTVTVIRHTPTFTWQGKQWNEGTNEVFNKLYDDYFVSSSTINNTSATLTPSSSDPDAADWSAGSSAQKLNLTTFYKETTPYSSIDLTVSQSQNYYWDAHSETHTITPKNLNNHVEFLMNTKSLRDALYHEKENSHGKITCSEGGEIALSQNSAIVWTANPLYYTIQFTGIPDKLSFDYKQTATSTAIGDTEKAFIVYESSDNKTWNQIWTTDGMPGNTSYERKEDIQLNPKTKYLKFFFDATYTGYYKDIHVTELNEFRAVDSQDKDLDKDTLDFGLQYVDAPSVTKTFDFKYANPGYKVQLKSTDPQHFTVEPTYIDTIGGEKYGTIKDIKVTYHPTEVHNTTDAKILIWDEAGHEDTVFLTVNTIKSKPTLSWTPEWSAQEPIVLLNQTVTNAATSSNGYSTVKYKLNDESDEDIIQIINDGTAFIGKGTGRAVITAYQEPDRVYEAPDEISKTFIVTDKIAQYIVWDDNLTNLRIDDAPITLNAQVWVMTDAASNTWEYSPEQTAKLQYSSPDNTIVAIENNILTINGVGELLIGATIQADDTYEYAHAQIPVRVRDHSTTCSDEDLIIPVKQNGTTLALTSKLSYDPYLQTSEHIVEIDRTEGIPGELIFGYYGREAWWTLSGRIRVYESSDNGSTWQQVLSDADAVTPNTNGLQYSPRIPLSPTATHIKFQRFESTYLGYHIIQYITVLPAKYIQAEDVYWGNIYVGNTPDTTITFNYSSVRGDMELSTSHANLSVTPTTIRKDCGDWGTESLTITLNANTTIIGEFDAQVFIHDQVGNISETIHVYANIVKNSPTITWTPTDTIRSSAEWETKKTAIASSGDQVLYEITAGNQPNEYAYLNNDGKMILLRGGQITARAYTPATTTSNEMSVFHDFIIVVDPLFEDFANDNNWLNDNNWNIGRTPWATDSATIKANKHVQLTTEVSIDGVQFEAGSSIHIASTETSTGGLSVGAQGIQGAASDGSSITIDNNPDGAGFLRISPTAPEGNKYPHFTMNFTTRAYNEGVPRDETWQYMGAPGNNATFKNLDSQTLIYHWDETKGWVEQSHSLLSPIPTWQGYALTQSIQANHIYQITAQAIQGTKTIDLTYTASGMKGDNLFVNSFTAPIDITKIDSTTDVTGDWKYKTFYFFNTGSWNDWQGTNPDHTHDDASSAGHYYAVPLFSAPYLEGSQTIVPPMQGVYVHTDNADVSITLDYTKHVWNGAAGNLPMRAPQKQSPDFQRVRIQVSSDNSGADRMYIIQEPSTTRDYDNGYDGKNINAQGQVNIYTNEPFGKMEVSCANNIDSMYIGLRTGNDTHYTLTFGAIAGDSLYLQDLENDSIIPLFNDEQYHFTAQPNTVNNSRFLLLSHPRFAPNTSTPTTDINGNTLAKIWSIGSTIYIANAPANSWATLYTVSGHLVLSTPIANTQSPATLDVSHLPQGVYILRLNNQVYKFVCK